MDLEYFGDDPGLQRIEVWAEHIEQVQGFHGDYAVGIGKQH